MDGEACLMREDVRDGRNADADAASSAARAMGRMMAICFVATGLMHQVRPS